MPHWPWLGNMHAGLSLLRTLMPEHRTDLIELQDGGIGLKAMLHIRPDDRGRSLRPQGQHVTISILEGVHLFFDYISALPNAAREKFQLLCDRSPDLAVPKPFEHLTGRVFNPLPPADLIGQNIIHASNGLNTLHLFPQTRSKFQHNRILLKKRQIKVKRNPLREINCMSGHQET